MRFLGASMFNPLMFANKGIKYNAIKKIKQDDILIVLNLFDVELGCPTAKPPKCWAFIPIAAPQGPIGRFSLRRTDGPMKKRNSTPEYGICILWLRT